MQDDARVERNQVLGRRQQRIDVDFLDPRLLDHELAEAHQQVFELGDVDGLASTNAFQRGEDLCLLHHAAGQRCVQRRQCQRAVLEDFYQLSAGSEQQHRAKLRIDAAADDDFVAIQLDHRLHGHALEVLRANLLRDRLLDRLESTARTRRRCAGSAARRRRRSCA